MAAGIFSIVVMDIPSQIGRAKTNASDRLAMRAHCRWSLASRSIPNSFVSQQDYDRNHAKGNRSRPSRGRGNLLARGRCLAVNR